MNACKVTEMVGTTYKHAGDKHRPTHEQVLTSWVSKVTNLGLDIETCIDQNILHRSKPDKKAFLDNLVNMQRLVFKHFDGLKNWYSLLELKKDIESGILDVNVCDKGGLCLARIASAYDRTDALEWLGDNMDQCLAKLDGQ